MTDDIDTPDGARGADGTADEYSGYVVVRLEPEVEAGDAEDLYEVARSNELGEILAVLDRLGRPRTARLITRTPPELIRQLERAAADSPFPPLHSLTGYWRVDLRDRPDDVAQAARLIDRARGVGTAYAEFAVTDAGQPGGPPRALATTGTLRQGHLEAAPEGIDARWAWTRPGGAGDLAGLVDLERGWWVHHVGIAEHQVPQTPVVGVNRNNEPDLDGHTVGDHGTAVLGVVAATGHDQGVRGVAPKIATLRVTSTSDGSDDVHVADAIVGVLPCPGDVLLLEVQRSYRPTETDPADLDAIRLACALGTVVVEAAGNSATDLDQWRDHERRLRLRRIYRKDFVDSGAILVGAVQAAVVPPGAHRWLPQTGYGSRIDCHAWGQSVVTCGYGDLGGTMHDDYLTGTFRQTSAASAIIAGAAVLVQSMYRAATGGVLSPGRLRALLSSGTTGTRATSDSPPLGVMPDLRAVVGAGFALVPGVHRRDEPSTAVAPESERRETVPGREGAPGADA